MDVCHRKGRKGFEREVMRERKQKPCGNVTFTYQKNIICGYFSKENIHLIKLSWQMELIKFAS